MAEPPPALIQKVLKVDTKFSHYLHSKFHTLLPIFFHLILEISADFRFSFPISFSLLFTLSLPSLLPFFSSLLLGLLLDLAAVGLIKILFRRPRPPYNHISSMSTPVSADHFSFPSGHSSRVSFVAALVFLYKEAIEVAVVELREKGGVFGSWVGEEGKLVDVVVVGVCAWAVVTAISRVLLGRHYFFDVFAGFCLGVIEGVFSFRVLRFEDLFSTFRHQILSR
ncbi:lipid phosphate phosphatase beta [Salix suchowensis]|nr:lipid phosphate phosphatase beta [Salix suchowensis]